MDFCALYADIKNLTSKDCGIVHLIVDTTLISVLSSGLLTLDIIVIWTDTAPHLNLSLNQY